MCVSRGERLPANGSIPTRRRSLDPAAPHPRRTSEAKPSSGASVPEVSTTLCAAAATVLKATAGFMAHRHLRVGGQEGGWRVQVAAAEKHCGGLSSRGSEARRRQDPAAAHPRPPHILNW